MISVAFFHVFMVNNQEKCPRDLVLARFYRPGGGGFELLFCPGVGNSPIKKIAWRFARRDGQAWN